MALANEYEFGAAELTIGSIRGYRSWRLTVDGRLKALHQSGIWMPGENTAVCNGYPTAEQVPTVEGEHYTETHRKRETWRMNHEMSDCAHGFYAYFSPGKLDQAVTTATPVINGVIEGYGEVLVGSKGFRATKARILAASIEPYMGMWTLADFAIDRIRHNYPDVAFFDSALLMALEYPADEATKYQVPVAW